MPRHDTAAPHTTDADIGAPAHDVIGHTGREAVMVPLAGSFDELSVRVVPLRASGFLQYRPPLDLVCMWDKRTGMHITDLSATSLRMSYIPQYEAFTTPAAFTALDDLARWTALPNERLAFMFRASRRSIYNWRQGAPVASDTGGRIARAHEALQPLGARYTPALLRQWLESRDPSPMQLLHEERWAELQARITAELQPAATRQIASATETQGKAHAFGNDTRRLMLERFRTGTELAPRRPDWRPRELTGLGDEEQDDE